MIDIGSNIDACLIYGISPIRQMGAETSIGEIVWSETYSKPIVITECVSSWPSCSLWRYGGFRNEEVQSMTAPRNY